jgi:RecJ-like exonuclease
MSIMDKRISIFLVLSLIGILFLGVINLLLPATTMNIYEINKNQLDKEIKLKVKIIEVVDFPKSSFQILTLQDETGEIKATSNSEHQLNITLNKFYTVSGKITEYNNTIQISINKIEEKIT